MFNLFFLEKPTVGNFDLLLKPGPSQHEKRWISEEEGVAGTRLPAVTGDLFCESRE